MKKMMILMTTNSKKTKTLSANYVDFADVWLAVTRGRDECLEDMFYKIGEICVICG